MVLLFGGYKHYGSGGINDLLGIFEDSDAALEAGSAFMEIGPLDDYGEVSEKLEWIQIFDTVQLNVKQVGRVYGSPSEFLKGMEVFMD